MSRIAQTLTAASIAVLLVSGQAFAHAHLQTSVPADKATVASPSEIDLTFSEELNLKMSGVKITGPDKSAVKLGEGMLMDGDKVLMLPVTGKLAPGSYKVEWHALSQDGHKTKGSYSFTVKP